MRRAVLQTLFQGRPHFALRQRIHQFHQFPGLGQIAQGSLVSMIFEVTNKHFEPATPVQGKKLVATGYISFTLSTVQIDARLNCTPGDPAADRIDARRPPITATTIVAQKLRIPANRCRMYVPSRYEARWPAMVRLSTGLQHHFVQKIVAIAPGDL
jgi:hypothetical protein